MALSLAALTQCMIHVRIYKSGEVTCSYSEYSIDLHVRLVQIKLYC